MQLSLRSASDKMARPVFLLYVTIIVLTSRMVYGAVNEVPLPDIDLDEWWGPGNATDDQDPSIRDFTTEFNKSMIDDLIRRLKSHRRFTEPLEGIAFQYGFNSQQLERWVKYLIEEYPFQERLAFLNQYPQYKVLIQGLDIHFIRVKSKNIDSMNVVPLLLLHGWPGSVREFYESIPYLVSMSEAKGFALDIIVPSLPGFGFSTGAVRPGLGADKMAIVLRNLMNRLGYSKYYIQGGDAGALVANVMATYFPNEVMGYHTNYVLLHTPDILFRTFLGSYNPEEVAEPTVLNRLYPLSKYYSTLIQATGYMHIQATKPDTVGIGLQDSPSGLMAYLMEKIASGGWELNLDEPDGGVTKLLTAEQIFDNIMIYWSSSCITTSMRLYSETLNKRYMALRINEIQTPVPFWALQAPDEMVYLPPWMLKMKYPNLLHETLPDEGGHFYAWTKPQPFAEDVTDAIIAFRDWHAMNSTLYESCSSYI